MLRLKTTTTYIIKYIVMKKISLILLVQFLVLQVFSQEKCTENDTSLVDLNTIAKCEITESNKSPKKKGVEEKNITIISKRYLKKRDVLLSKGTRVSSTIKTKKISHLKQERSFLDIEIIKVKEKMISFKTIEEIPLFSSCVDASINKEDCFNYEMQKHIITHFKYPEKALDRGIEGNLEVSFVIDKEGNVKDIKVTGVEVHKILIKEAKRIAELLPKFIPGKENGIPKDVLYSFPINFTID